MARLTVVLLARELWESAGIHWSNVLLVRIGQRPASLVIILVCSDYDGANILD